MAGVAGEEDGLAFEFEQGLVFFDAFVEALADVPDGAGVVVAAGWAGGEDGVVHQPVMVFAEGHAVGRAVVATFAERDEVRGIDQVDIAEKETHAAGGAADIVQIADDPAEGGRADTVDQLVAARRHIGQQFLFPAGDQRFFL